MTRVRTVAAVAGIAALAFGLNLACALAAAFLVHGVVPPPATPEWPGDRRSTRPARDPVRCLVRRTPGDANPRWLCLLVAAAPVVAGLALAWGRPGAVRPPAGDWAPTTATTATAETRSSTRR